MRNIWTIARREYKLFFISPIAYVVAFLFMLVLGLFFSLTMYGSISQMAYSPTAPSPQMVISPMVTILLFTIPAVTMRTIAEEQRSGTMELLLTAPVRDWELVLGKWLGSFLFMASLLLLTGVFPLVLNFMVKPGIDFGPVIAGYLGLLLLSSSMLAIGVMVSALFANQIAAFFISLGVVLALWLSNQFTSYVQGFWKTLLDFLDIITHFVSFYRGTIALKDVVFFISLTALFLFFGTALVEWRRWR